MREHPIDQPLPVPPFLQRLDRAHDEGKAEGAARSVLLFLKARDLQPTDEQRVHIMACRNQTILEKWIERAATVRTVKELFGDDA